ncbi:conserved Plasmodium protein, unknown function [Plasmodium sp. DRC-Itaito]|nr:conserved Plasmodium protein, unknown function [Plasmodium sp. DRC-Itaito]
MNNKARSKKEKYLYNQYDQCYDIFLKKNDITNIVIPEKKSEVTNTHIQFEQKKNQKKRKEKYAYRIIKIIKSHENKDIVFYSVKNINKINKIYKINKIKKYNLSINPCEHISKDIYLKKKKNSLPSNNINSNLSIVEENKNEKKNVTYILKQNHNYNLLKYNNFIILAEQKRKKYKSKKIKSIRKFNYSILKKRFSENDKDHYNNKNNIKYDNNIYYYNTKTQKYNGYVNRQNDHLIYKEYDTYKNTIIDHNKIKHHDNKKIHTFNYPLINTLINNIKYISNYEYMTEKKLCYDCYSTIKLKKIKRNVDTNKNDINDYTYININEYMKKEKKKKIGGIKNIYPNKLNRNEKNKKLKNSYIFTYGFYSKKGKYHINEDCSSHTLFSSYKIFKQIKRFYLNLKKRKYFIKCNSCRRLYKYDNLVNEHILNIYRRDNILMSPLVMFNRSHNILRSLLLSCYKNKNRKNLKYYIINCLYIQTCRKVRKEIKKDFIKENKKKRPIIEKSFNNINICDTTCHSSLSNSSYYYSDLEVYTKDQVWKGLEKKLKRCLLINRLNKYHRSNSCNIRRDEPNSVESFIMYKEDYINNNYMSKDIIYMVNKDVHNKFVDNKYISSIITKDNLINKEMLLKYSKRKNKIHSLYEHYDIHLFTICDGHSSCHTSLFLIKNIHKIFYYLLIHTFFNISMSLKLIHPFLDLLYYKMCMENNLKKSHGSCIINVFIRKNYIYVSNTGDSKCSLMTFNLDMYDYDYEDEDMKKKKKTKQKKKKKKIGEKGMGEKGMGEKGMGEKGMGEKGMGTCLNMEEDIINSQVEKIKCDDNIYDKIKTKDKEELNYKSYKISTKSISYNELNAEHNCNNYSEYLRIYKIYMKDYDIRYNHKVSAHNGYRTNMGEDHTYHNLYVNKSDKNISKNISKNTCCKNTCCNNTNKKYHCDNHPCNNTYDNLKDTILQINNFILKEKEETQINIGNIPNDIIKYNRLNGCLHPSRVIGDYDIKKRYNKIYKNILSNYSNIYKYNMNNINFYNNIHYLYKYKKCLDCGKNYVLNSYGKVNGINDLTLLKKQNKNLNITNADKNTVHFVNAYEMDSKQNKNIDDNFYHIKKNKNNNNYNNIRNFITHSNVIKVYKENLYNHNYNMDIQSNDNKKKNNFHFYPDEQLLPYLHFKHTNLNKNYVYKFDKKNFFHLLIIASDGIFEYINPYIILNIIKKHKSIYTKIQKIYYFYNNYIKYMNTTNYYVNYMTHHFLITSKECFELSRDIVKTTIRMGNYDDSSCFCIFLFPQFA